MPSKTSGCPCGPGCKCVDGSCGCGTGDCGCSPTCAASTVVVKIEGMTCGGCSAGVERALIATAGVKSASVDLPSKLATVKGTASSADIVAAIAKAGYKAAGCACSCGPDCKCVAGECGCATGSCACDPSVCSSSSSFAPSSYGVHLALAASVGLIAGIILAKKVL